MPSQGANRAVSTSKRYQEGIPILNVLILNEEPYCITVDFHSFLSVTDRTGRQITRIGKQKHQQAMWPT
jgi:hypothetical protein